jgi:hypothetical protein
MHAHGDTPASFQQAAQVLRSTFPKDKFPDLANAIEQQISAAQESVRNGTPIKQIADALIARSASQQKQSNEAPGQIADAALKQQVTAGSVGGITPEQQAQNAASQASQTETARHNRAEEGFAQQRLAAENPLGGPGASQNLATAPADEKGQHPEVLKALPNATSAQVKAMVEGRQQFPSSFALKTPYWQKMLDYAAQYDPGFDATVWQQRLKTRQAFTSGKEAQQVNKLNTAINHLEELRQVTDALHNRSGFPGATSYNAVANALMSSAGNPARGNFDTVVGRVGPEIIGAYGEAGGEGNIREATSKFSSSAAKEQNYGALLETAKLIKSKIEQMQTQYETGMGRATDRQLVSPQAQAIIDRLAGSGQQSATLPPVNQRVAGKTEAVINGVPMVWAGTGWKPK